MLKRRQYLENVDAGVGVVLAFGVATLGLIGTIPSQVVSAAVLMTLGLSLVVILRLRTQINAVSDDQAKYVTILKALQRRIDKNATVASVIRYEYPDLVSFIDSAERIDIAAGLSLKSTVGLYYSAFARAMRRGVHVRAICPDPDNAALMSAAAQVRPEVRRVKPLQT